MTVTLITNIQLELLKHTITELMFSSIQAYTLSLPENN